MAAESFRRRLSSEMYYSDAGTVDMDVALTEVADDAVLQHPARGRHYMDVGIVVYDREVDG